jgi:hypothetical protein
VLTERCLGGDAMQSWVKSGIRNGAYQAPVPRELAASFFADHGFTLAGSFMLPMPPGAAERLVFRRRPCFPGVPGIDRQLATWKKPGRV